MIVRSRTEEDLATCAALVRASHDVDGYPARLPDDPRAFLDAPGAIAAWVADISGEIAGHVALHPASSPAVMDLASAVTGLPAEKFGVVARLLVPHSARGRGVGSSLLRAAASRSVDIGRRPILDVHTALEPCGWVRIGIVAVTFQNGVTLDEFVYLAPDDTDQPS